MLVSPVLGDTLMFTLVIPILEYQVEYEVPDSAGNCALHFVVNDGPGSCLTTHESGVVRGRSGGRSGFLCLFLRLSSCLAFSQTVTSSLFIFSFCSLCLSFSNQTTLPGLVKFSIAE